MMRLIMLLVGIVAALIVVGSIWIDEGEVVTLMTTDADATVHATQLWIVELDGDRYLRASNADVAWLERLRARPLVELEVADASVYYRAIPMNDPELLTRLASAMERKYGLADRLWGVLRDRSRTIPIRLEPAADPESLGDAS